MSSLEENEKLATAQDETAKPSDELDAALVGLSANPDKIKVLTALILPALTFLVGGGVPIDTAIGVQMGKAMGHGVRAAFLSYIMVFLCLLPLVLVSWLKAPKEPLKEPLDQLHTTQEVPFRWWYLTGGILTAAAQTSALLLVPVIGNSLFFVCLVSGQLVSSLVIDHFGILVERKRLTRIKAMGVVIVFTGCILEQNFNNDASAVRQALFSVVSLVAGLCIPSQAVINRRFAAYLGSYLQCITVTFGVGTVALLVCALISLSSSPWTLHHTEVWYWFEFATVLLYIGSSVVFPKHIGMASYFVLILAGKLSMSLITDNYGLFKCKVVKAEPRRIVGCVLAVLGALVIQCLGKRHASDVVVDQIEGQEQAFLPPGDLDELENGTIQSCGTK